MLHFVHSSDAGRRRLAFVSKSFHGFAENLGMAGIGSRMMPLGRIARTAAAAAVAAGLLSQHAAYAEGGGPGSSGQPHEMIRAAGQLALAPTNLIEPPIVLRPSFGRPAVGAVGSMLPQVQKRPLPPPVWQDALTAPARRPLRAEDVLPPVIARPAMLRPESAALSLARPTGESASADPVDGAAFEAAVRSGAPPGIAGTSRLQSVHASSALNARGFPAARPRIPLISWAPVHRPSDYGDVRCLAEAIYFEARGESRQGWQAVAEVILNRVESRSYPDTICAVVSQGAPSKNQCQFSYNCDGLRETIAEREIFGEIRELAQRLLRGDLKPIAGGATHFHARSVNPRWSERFELTAVIGRHLFYQQRHIN